MAKNGNGLSLLQLISFKELNQLCEKWNINKRVRKLTAQKQVWVLVIASLVKLESLREIESALGVPKSTLSV